MLDGRLGEAHLFRRFPVECGDLPARESDEGVAGADRMIEERERVVARVWGKPQGELAEVHGDGVPVHAVEAALGGGSRGTRRARETTSIRFPLRIPAIPSTDSGRSLPVIPEQAFHRFRGMASSRSEATLGFGFYC
jgi:hypothetical protein